MTQKPDSILLFEVFKEIGIIEQLSRTLLEARLPAGLIAPHFSVLNHLINRGDGAVPIDMARAFQVPKTSMTHTLKGLVAHGLIELRANPDDGRSKRVWLTDAGCKLRDDTIQALSAEFSALAEGFDVEKLAQIKPVLTALRVYLDDAREV
ncbi:MAG: MarR family winged helix-turn-helix transcriptional regulator [Sulfitobacter sp.]